MNLEVEIDEVRDAQRATVIAAVEARRTGLIWQRRKGVEKRLGFDPAQVEPEGEEEALAAGRAMRDRQRALLSQVPDLPDRYDPTSARPPSRRSATPDPDAPPAKLQRVRLPSISDDEDLPPAHRRHPDSTPFRIESDTEFEELRPSPLPPDSGTQIALNLLFGEHAPQVEKSGPSHGGDGSAAPTPRETQRLFSSDEEEDSMERAAPRAGLVRRGRG